jgi:copper oxidase (laccase) domain-containing protein
LTAAGPDHANLDLVAALRADVVRGGVAAVTSSGVCTATDERLHSYRQQGPGPRQLLVAWS